MDLQVINKMTGIVSDFLGNKELEGFAKAYHLATAVEGLRELLTPEYMAPIMKLQGSKLGFRTDKDKLKDGSKGPGYPVEVVRECLIEAVLFGVQPVGNQFNIIKDSTYITKDGFGYLLRNIPALTWKIAPSLPRMSGNSAAIVMKIEYTHSGVKGSQELDIPIKINEHSSTDQVSGKAERKARAWLHKTITGSETPEGDVLDIDAVTVKTTLKEEAITKEQLSEILSAKVHLLSAEEVDRANEIIGRNETTSFKKLQTLLNSK